MHYVISDVHGEFDRYQKLKDMIHFSEMDTLYILGDMIDRGPGGIDVVRDAMAHPNIIPILGNHEGMCLDTLGIHNQFGARSLWQSNGGSITRRELLYHMPAAEKNKILRYLESLPDHLDIVVKGQRFHLVHGWVGTSRDARIWERPTLDALNPLGDASRVIVGHTPICYLYYPEGGPGMVRWLRALEEDDDHMRIEHREGFICIDCGCGNPTKARRLACLRLEDMVEFYV